MMGKNPDAAGRPRVILWVEQDAYGEYARYAADLARAWQSETEISIWLEQKTAPADMGTVPTQTGIRISRLAASSRIRHLRAARPAILVLIGVRAARYGIRAARKAGVEKVVYVALSDLIYQDHSLLRVARNYLLLNSIARRTDRIVVPANGSRYQFLLREWVSEAKFHLLPKMFDPREVPPTSTPSPFQENGPRPTCRVVYAGPLYSRARLDWLLRAWAFVEEQELDAHLSIVGTGPCEEDLRKLSARLALAHCDIIRPEHPLIHYVAASDIVAMTSLYELHSRLPLMAMGCGKPVIAMEADGIRITLRNNEGGLLTPLGDISAFADTLATLIRDADRQKSLGASGLPRAAQFGPEPFAKRAYALLASLLSGSERP